MTPQDAKAFLQPKWKVKQEVRNAHDTGWLLTLHTGQDVEVNDDGTFHVSGKGWQAINTRLQEGQWPPYAAVQTQKIKQDLTALGVTQLSYFSEGLNCIQFAQAPRAAIVLAWSGFVDLLHQRFARDLPAFNAALKMHRSKLHAQTGDFSGLADFAALKDVDAIDIGHHLRIYDHHVKIQLDAMRDLRNTSAHIAARSPDIQIALGFYSHIVPLLPTVL